MTLLTREALERNLVAGDTDLCRSVLLAVVLSTRDQRQQKLLATRSRIVIFLILGLVTKSHGRQAT